MKYLSPEVKYGYLRLPRKSYESVGVMDGVVGGNCTKISDH